jgi:AraC-like DNA-binding protein
MSFSFFHVLLIVGITHGFVIIALITFKKQRSNSKILLSLILFLFNILCIKILILSSTLHQINSLRYLPLSVELAISPLLWLYVVSLVKPDFKFERKFLIHFIPFGGIFVYSVVVYVLVLPQFDFQLKVAIGEKLLYYIIKQWEDYLTIVSAVAYWLAGVKLVIDYRKWLNNNISNTDCPTYSWLLNISISMAVLIGGLVVATVLEYAFDFGVGNFLHWQVFYVYLAILIYYIGFKGFQLPDRLSTQSISIETTIVHQYNTQRVDVKEAEREKEIALSIEKQKQIELAIVEALETKELYLDPELSLQKLSKEINQSPSSVSLVINSVYKKSFRNVINDYRLKKVKQRLQNPKANNYSIFGTASECGFNSEASFYRIFKTAEGVSPKEYLTKLKG